MESVTRPCRLYERGKIARRGSFHKHCDCAARLAASRQFAQLRCFRVGNHAEARLSGSVASGVTMKACRWEAKEAGQGMDNLRIGQILIDQGVLNAGQVDAILCAQQRTGRPFGVICEQLFDVPAAAVECAWSEQYARLTRQVDPDNEIIDPQALSLVDRRQAWQFCVLPVRFDGEELMIATTRQHLLRALKFACNVLEMPAYIVLTEPQRLGRALARHYPLPGMTPAMIGCDEAGNDCKKKEKSAAATRG